MLILELMQYVEEIALIITNILAFYSKPPRFTRLENVRRLEEEIERLRGGDD